jgi:hypothetical protein
MPPFASTLLVIGVCVLDGQDRSKQRNDEILGLVLHLCFGGALFDDIPQKIVLYGNMTRFVNKVKAARS